jgi:anaerobic selenocysteine-containing dehydrogenase
MPEPKNHEITKRTVCARDCYDACSLIITLDQHETIQAVKGDPGHPLTRGLLCPRSAKDKERLYANRINTPFFRKNNPFKQSGWHQTLDVISDKLAETISRHGPESILFLNYAGNTGLFANAFPHRLWNALGATQTDGALCSQSGHLGLSLHYGLSYGANPAEMARCGLVVFWGINPAVSAPHLWQLALDARKNGTSKIIVIDPINTRSAQKADLWIRPKPATDVALAYGIIHQLIVTGNTDGEFIQQWTSGFEHLKDEAERWPLSKVETLTGLHPNLIRHLAELYGAVKPSLTFIGYALQQCDGGADQVRAVSMIPAVVGMHRGFFYGNGSAYDIDTATLKGKSLSQKKPTIVRQVAVADHVRRGDFKFIFVSCMNPAVTLPNQKDFRNGIKRSDVFLTVHDSHWTKTAAYAHAVLPAPTFLEKDDIVIPDSHNTILWSEKAVSPLKDSRHEIWVMRQIARRLDLKESWLYEDPDSAVRHAMSRAFEAGNFDDLLSGKRLALKCRPEDEYQTESGKLEFYSHAAAARGWSPLPRFRPRPASSFPFTYITSSIAKYTHTQFQEIYGPIPAFACLHPGDAAKNDIEPGDTIFIFNESGRIKLKARITDNIPQGVVWSPKELEGLDGTAQNCLTSSLPQEMGGGPRFNSTRVGVSKGDPLESTP